MTTKELKEIAKNLKVKNWWTLKKAELIEEIEKAEKLSQNAQNDVEDNNDEVIKDDEKVAQNEPEATEEPKKKARGKMIEYNGKSQSLNAWAKELGMPGQTLFARLYISNWSIEKAFTTPSRRKNKEEA